MVCLGVVPQLTQREPPPVSLSWTQHIEPVCIASHSVTFWQGLTRICSQQIARASVQSQPGGLES